MLETSLAVFNKSLYERLTPRSVPCWVRVNVANRLANTGKTMLFLLLAADECSWVFAGLNPYYDQLPVAWDGSGRVGGSLREGEQRHAQQSVDSGRLQAIPQG